MLLGLVEQRFAEELSVDSDAVAYPLYILALIPLSRSNRSLVHMYVRRDPFTTKLVESGAQGCGVSTRDCQ